MTVETIIEVAAPSAPKHRMDAVSGSGVELTLVVPVKDEEACIGPFLEQTISILARMPDPAANSFEILFIDDGSSDGTIDRIRAAHRADPRVRGISLSRNFGKESALSAGLDHATGRAVIPMDVDLQDPPEVIPQMIEKWRQGYEMVCGIRDDRQSDSLSKRVSANWFYKVHNRLSADSIPEQAGDFRLLDRVVVDVIRSLPERNRFMKGLFAWPGFRQTSVPYRRAQRGEGTTKYSYWKLWTLGLDGIISASTIPLKVWSYIGGAIALVSFVYAVFIVILAIVSGIGVPGYASLMVAILFLGGLQLLSLGVLGEYVARLMTEAKQRPLYVVREQIGGEGS